MNKHDRYEPQNSLWRATAEPAPVTTSLEGLRRTEVTVIGGGFTGLSAALHLAEQGRDVTLIEAGELGWGASGLNGGQVIPGLKYDPDELEEHFGPDMGPRMVRTVGATADLVFDLIQTHGIRCDAVRKGWIQGAHCQRALERQRARDSQWRARGANTRMLDRQTLATITGSSAYEGGWLDTRGGTVQPLSYARGLASAAQRLGANLYTDSPALELRQESAGWLIRTAQGEVRSPQVILATNAYSDRLWPGLRQSVVPAYSMQVATEPLPQALRETVLPGGQSLSETRRNLRYGRLDPTGRFIIGMRGPRRPKVGMQDAEGLRNVIKELFPALSGLALEYIWTGCVAMTQDHLPHLHELAPGLHSGLGYNGRGIGMASMFGRLLAQRVQGVPAAEIDFPSSPLSPIPFHSMTPGAVAVTAHYYSLLDRWKL